MKIDEDYESAADRPAGITDARLCLCVLCIFTEFYCSGALVSCCCCSAEHSYCSCYSPLRGAVRQLQNVVEPPEDVVYPIELPTETSQNVWECVKCATVNKAETTHCAHCGSAYAVSVNPTDDPTKKRVMSRWVKDNKKRRGLFDRNTNS